jgi:16S rRNA processing protein RimM
VNPRIKKILEDMVPIGILGKVHGLHGEVKMTVFTNVVEILENLEEVFLYSEEKSRGFFLKVEAIRVMPKKLLVKFEEFDTREDAEALEGFKVFVRRENLPELGEDEYYYEEIYDCEVYEEGKDIGKVVDIIDTGSNEVLVVEKEGKETLVPMIKDYIEEVDTKNKIIKIRKMEWI